jgi:hypothetical protein
VCVQGGRWKKKTDQQAAGDEGEKAVTTVGLQASVANNSTCTVHATRYLWMTPCLAWLAAWGVKPFNFKDLAQSASRFFAL